MGNATNKEEIETPHQATEIIEEMKSKSLKVFKSYKKKKSKFISKYNFESIDKLGVDLQKNTDNYKGFKDVIEELRHFENDLMNQTSIISSEYEIVETNVLLRKYKEEKEKDFSKVFNLQIF